MHVFRSTAQSTKEKALDGMWKRIARDAYWQQVKVKLQNLVFFFFLYKLFDCNTGFAGKHQCYSTRQRNKHNLCIGLFVETTRVSSIGIVPCLQVTQVSLDSGFRTMKRLCVSSVSVVDPQRHGELTVR